MDGSQADQTVPFGLDGAAYEIDLSNSNANALRATREPFVAAARRTGGRRIKVAVGQVTDATEKEPRATDDYTATHDIRSWARNKGYEVADRGRIPASVVDAYHAFRTTGSPKISRKPASRSKPQKRTMRQKNTQSDSAQKNHQGLTSSRQHRT
ncbi:Lsr2 family protein [Amycolatopsis sp. A133]|uniref:Lsr2 family protein n=1 Tax=Amycolatopsis sp. A133 TaxID=3064472 RepID=UPI0037BE6711